MPEMHVTQQDSQRESEPSELDSLQGNSSVLHTPPTVSYPNLVKPSHTKARSLRRQPSGIIDCYHVLTKTFGYSEYKGKQREIVEAAVLGADVFVLAPTGMGKSLCFQIPAVADKHGVTIVVSPLLALMKNQVANLHQKHVPVASFTSETSQAEKQEITKDLLSGHPLNRLLYITPEKLCSHDFMKMLQKVYEQGELNRLVVDEAHCISEWGHDFRAEYRRLGIFREQFSNVPIMALTATATPAVQLDIIRTLKMSEEHLFKAVHPFNRANLFYEVRYTSSADSVSQMKDICDYICTLHRRRKRPSSGIIYCRTRATCDALSAYLRGQGLSARPYHRGINSKTLDKTQNEWQVGGSGEGGIDVVVATVAFGLGIDKGDVRYIIHYDFPKSFEGFYQETGRAGRDGSPSKCILYYSREDVIRVKNWVNSSHNRRTHSAHIADGPAPSQRAVDSLMALVKFAESTDTCRHVSICRYFGESINVNDVEIVRRYCNLMCDICKYPDKTKCRKSKLSSKKYVGSQVATLQQQSVGDEDNEDDGYRPALPAGPSRSKPEAHDGWKKRFRDGDDDNSTDCHSVLRPAASATNKRPLSNFSGSKRPGSSIDNDKSRTKKFKVAYPPPLVTKPFDSVHNLKKPFKTPFKTPIIPHQNIESVEHHIQQAVNTKMIIIKDKDGTDDARIQNDDNTANNDPSPPIALPYTDVEIEVSFSKKIPVSVRYDAFNAIRQALHRVFTMGPSQDQVWGYFHSAFPSPDKRNHTLSIVAQKLEFSAHSLCSTLGGYKQRTTAKIDAVKLLAQAGPWHEGDAGDFEDATEIIDVVRQVCANQGKKGKGKAR